ncbi:MAG TPA: geranylgeranylglycerol-phosphate geranylgeranyltransferase [bacterium]|nr:geranylgeranylglycerol-phosphate geranylgeranyltransferase [bacterium]
MKQILQYIRLMRPLNSFIGALGILLGGHLTGNLQVEGALWFAVLTAVAMTGGANAINDYYDYEIDKINKPHRPLFSGVIHRENARWFAYALFTVGLLASILIGPILFLIAAGSVFLLEGYSRWWKRQPVIGNFVVSIMIAVAFLYGAAAFGKIWAALPPAYMGLLYTWGRELIKDLEDLEADAAEQANTLPILLGEHPTKILATVLFLLLILGVIIPYVLEIYNVVYLILVLVGVNLPILYIIIRLWNAESASEYRHLSHVLKADMFVGLLAVFAGSF